MRASSMEFSRSGERFTATNIPLGALVLTAWDITVRQLSAPASFPTERYDVAAKAEHAVSPDEMLRMLQALLAERFRLAVHRQIREVPVYSLDIAKGGPKLHRSEQPGTADITPRTPSRAAGTEAGGIELRSGHLIFKSESMSDFAWALSRMAGIGDRLVVDNTGLTGTWDFELTFDRGSTAPGVDVDAPSIFSALQEQLGLRLQPKKGPVEFLIIDHVERPSGN